MATFIDIIDRPRSTFQQVHEQPRKWIWPAVLIVISMVVLAIVVSTATGSLFSAFRNQLGSGGVPTASQGAVPSGQQAGAPAGQDGAPSTNRQLPQGSFPAAGRTAVAGFTSLPLTIGLKLSYLILAWLLTAALGLLLVKLFKGTGTFGHYFAVAVLASIPFLFRSLTQLVYYWVTKNLVLVQGLAFMVRSGRNAGTSALALSSLLGNIDLFTLWFFILLGIGLGTVGQLRWWKAALVTIVLAAVILGIRLVPTLLNIGITAPVLG